MKLSDVKKPTLYTLEEVAQQMGMSYHMLYRIVRAGKIKAVDTTKVPGTRRRYGFTAEAVQEYYDNLQNPIARPQSKRQ